MNQGFRLSGQGRNYAGGAVKAKGKRGLDRRWCQSKNNNHRSKTNGNATGNIVSRQRKVGPDGE